MSLTYKDAGVNIEAGEEVVEKIKDEVKSTHGPEVLTGLGGFGAMFAPDLSDYKNPVLVSGTDGVGTKLKVAFRADKHDSVGIDLVAMCVNDILAQGAKPLFFLDYLASGKLNSDQMSQVVSGIAKGCRRAGCALVGGETAEMPGFYQKGEYDMAGFAVGLADKKKIITGDSIKPRDIVIGLASNGLHSNGFSLVRKIFFQQEDYSITDTLPDNTGSNNAEKLGEELLKPTRIYVKPLLKIIENFQIKGLAHITGGGLTENINRVLSDKLKAEIQTDAWKVPNIFKSIQNLGEISDEEMYRTFNMGIGMVLILDEKSVRGVLDKLDELGEKAYVIGQIKERENSRGIVYY